MRGGIDAWNGLTATGEYSSGMFLIQGKKTAEEYIALAWALEDSTGKFYRKVQEVVPDESVKKVFDSLVKAEQVHKSTVHEAYRRIKGHDVPEEMLRKEMESGFMESGISAEEAVSWAMQKGRTPQEILEFSMQLEINSLDLYMKVLREIGERDVQNAFRALIEEEKRHLQRLGNVLNDMYNV